MGFYRHHVGGLGFSPLSYCCYCCIANGIPGHHSLDVEQSVVSSPSYTVIPWFPTGAEDIPPLSMLQLAYLAVLFMNISRWLRRVCRAVPVVTLISTFHLW